MDEHLDGPRPSSEILGQWLLEEQKGNNVADASAFPTEG